MKGKKRKKKEKQKQKRKKKRGKNFNVLLGSGFVWRYIRLSVAIPFSKC